MEIYGNNQSVTRIVCENRTEAERLLVYTEEQISDNDTRLRNIGYTGQSCGDTYMLENVQEMGKGVTHEQRCLRIARTTLAKGILDSSERVTITGPAARAAYLAVMEQLHYAREMDPDAILPFSVMYKLGQEETNPQSTGLRGLFERFLRQE